MRLEQESVKRKPLLRASADDARLIEKKNRTDKGGTRLPKDGNYPNQFIIVLLRALAAWSV